MLFRQSESGNRTVALALVTLFIFSILGAMAPASPLSSSVEALEDVRVVAPVSVPEQTYELYLDAATSETGGQGSITTIEPNGGQEEGSAIDGLEFRSAEMISDLYINGSGASNTARLSAYIQFRGAEGSTADVTFSLKSGDTQITSENRQLEDPARPILWVVAARGVLSKWSLMSAPTVSWWPKGSNPKSALTLRPRAKATPAASVSPTVRWTSPSERWKVPVDIPVSKS